MWKPPNILDGFVRDADVLEKQIASAPAPSDIETRLVEAQTALAEAERVNAALLSSTSWRLGAPIRGIVYLVRGRISVRDAIRLAVNRTRRTNGTHAESAIVDEAHAAAPEGDTTSAVNGFADEAPAAPPRLSASERHFHSVLVQRIRSI